MNKYALSSGDVGIALSNAASALALAGNDIDQSIAMIAAMTEVTQEASESGNALKILSMRLRGAKTDLEAAGESTDGMVVSTSTLRETIMALTNTDGAGGFDIMLDDSTFKSTYDIMLGIAEVWKDISNIDQAALLEIIAGKQRGNSISALLTQMAQAENVLSDSMNSAGSAMKEHEKWLDSIQAKLNQFNAAFEGLSVAFIDNELVKGVIEFGTSAINGLTTITEHVGALPTLIGLATAAMGLFGKQINAIELLAGKSLGQIGSDMKLAGDGTVSSGMTGKLSVLRQGLFGDTDILKFNSLIGEGDDVINDFVDSLGEGRKSLTGYLRTVNAGEATIKGYNAYCKASGTAVEIVGTKAKLASVGVNILRTTMNMLINVGIGLAIQAVISGITNLANASKDAQERAGELTQSWQDQKETIKSTGDNINALSDDYIKLSEGIDENGKNISLSSEEYERYNEIVNQIAEMFPLMVEGYTDEGNAIIAHKGNVEELTKAYEDMKQAAQDAIIVGSNNAWKGFAAATSGSSLLDQRTLTSDLEFLQNVLNNTISKDIADQLSGVSEWADVLRDAGLSISFFDGGNDILEKIDEDKIKISAYVRGLQRTIDSETSKIKPILPAFLSQDDSYLALDQELKTVVDKIISSLDYDFYSRFENADHMYSWVEEQIIAPLSDPSVANDIKKAFETISNPNLKLDMSVSDHAQAIKDSYKQLESLPQELQGVLNQELLFNLSLAVDEDSIAESLRAAHPQLDSLVERILRTYNVDDINALINIPAEAFTFEVPESLLSSEARKAWQDAYAEYDNLLLELSARIQTAQESGDTQLAETLTSELNSTWEALNDIGSILTFDATSLPTVLDEFKVWFENYESTVKEMAQADLLDEAFVNANKRYDELAEAALRFRDAQSETEKAFAKSAMDTILQNWQKEMEALSQEIAETDSEELKAEKWVLLADMAKQYEVALGFVSETTAEATDKTAELNTQLDEIQSAYDVVKAAVKEYKETGTLSYDTTLKLLDLGEGYLQYLYDENGNLVLNEEAFRRLTIAKLLDLQASKTMEMQDLVQKWKDEAKSVEDLKNEWLGAAQAKLLYSGMSFDFGEYEDAPQVQEFMNQLSLINDLITNIQEGNVSLGSSKSSSSSAKKATEPYEVIISKTMILETQLNKVNEILSQNEKLLNDAQALNNKDAQVELYEERIRLLEQQQDLINQINELNRADISSNVAKLNQNGIKVSYIPELNVLEFEQSTQEIQDVLNSISLGDIDKSNEFKKELESALDTAIKLNQEIDQNDSKRTEISSLIGDTETQLEGIDSAFLKNFIQGQVDRLDLELQLTGDDDFAERMRLIKGKIKGTSDILTVTQRDIDGLITKIRNGEDVTGEMAQQLSALELESLEAQIALKRLYGEFDDEKAAEFQNSIDAHNDSIKIFTDRIAELEFQLAQLGENDYNKRIALTTLQLAEQEKIVAANREEYARLLEQQGEAPSEALTAELERLNDEYREGTLAALDYRTAIGELGLAMRETQWNEAVSKLNNIKSLYEVLKTAAKEYSTANYITVDTFQELASLGTEYLTYLVDENGQLDKTG